VRNLRIQGANASGDYVAGLASQTGIWADCVNGVVIENTHVRNTLPGRVGAHRSRLEQRHGSVPHAECRRPGQHLGSDRPVGIGITSVIGALVTGKSFGTVARSQVDSEPCCPVRLLSDVEISNNTFGNYSCHGSHRTLVRTPSLSGQDVWRHSPYSIGAPR
jgi:hypothetical protein